MIIIIIMPSGRGCGGTGGGGGGFGAEVGQDVPGGTLSARARVRVAPGGWNISSGRMSAAFYIDLGAGTRIGGRAALRSHLPAAFRTSHEKYFTRAPPPPPPPPSAIPVCIRILHYHYGTADYTTAARSPTTAAATTGWYAAGARTFAGRTHGATSSVPPRHTRYRTARSHETHPHAAAPVRVPLHCDYVYNYDNAYYLFNATADATSACTFSRFSPVFGWIFFFSSFSICFYFHLILI